MYLFPGQIYRYRKPMTDQAFWFRVEGDEKRRSCNERLNARNLFEANDQTDQSATKFRESD
jgi:hypothetical protein